ncbi:MAG TPA: hypothetical protein VF432_25165 [Thermoanaerobaculia bacterium]
MRSYGSDRFRVAGGKVILHSRLAKGWTPRTEKTLTSAEFPGTAVYWDEQYYEVLAADPLPAGGVRYVLAEWRDDHAIRQFQPYNEESEARLAEDHQRAARQRKHSTAARFSAMFLGHLPAHVQMHLGHELGLFPHRMTLWSIVPVLAATILFVYITIDTFMRSVPNPVPDVLLLLAFFMLAESVLRFLVAMTQLRAMGSLLGMLVYLFVWLLHPNRQRLVSPFASAKGEGLMTLPPPPGVEERDSLEMRAPLLTLLTPAEQLLLAERFGFDYRKHAYGITWAMLVCAALGVASMLPKASQSLSALVSLICAGLVVLEQAVRLLAFKRGPAGSVFGALVRPFARDLLGTR